MCRSVSNFMSILSINQLLSQLSDAIFLLTWSRRMLCVSLYEKSLLRFEPLSIQESSKKVEP